MTRLLGLKKHATYNQEEVDRLTAVLEAQAEAAPAPEETAASEEALAEEPTAEETGISDPGDTDDAPLDLFSAFDDEVDDSPQQPSSTQVVLIAMMCTQLCRKPCLSLTSRMIDGLGSHRKTFSGSTCEKNLAKQNVGHPKSTIIDSFKGAKFHQFKEGSAFVCTVRGTMGLVLCWLSARSPR